MIWHTEFLAPIWGDVLIVDDEEGVSDLNARACDRGRGENALTHLAELISVGLVSCPLVLEMAT